MNKPHTNHTSKAFADITGIINELPIKKMVILPGCQRANRPFVPDVFGPNWRFELILLGCVCLLLSLGLPDGLPMI
jgi:hypothetical protein